MNQGGPAVPTHSLSIQERSLHVNHKVAGPAVCLPPLQSTQTDRVGYRCKDITQQYIYICLTTGSGPYSVESIDFIVAKFFAVPLTHKLTGPTINDIHVLFIHYTKNQIPMTLYKKNLNWSLQI